MSLKLMYITNNIDVAVIAERAGVDWIFVDMEYIGKADRQSGMDTVQSHHTIEDIRRIRKVLRKSKLLVRINPIHAEGNYRGIDHASSVKEIEDVINAGADIIMLTYFKSIEEVQFFLEAVHGRTKTMLLLETAEAEELAEDICQLPGIDYIHIGLNDLSLGKGMQFMFQLLSDGTVDKICQVLQKNHITYGFGGVASPGEGLLPAEYIIYDHYRLMSSCVILSRSFCNTDLVKDYGQIESIFMNGVKAIRRIEAEAERYTEEDFYRNHLCLIDKVNKVLDIIQKR